MYIIIIIITQEQRNFLLPPPDPPLPTTSLSLPSRPPPLPFNYADKLKSPHSYQFSLILSKITPFSLSDSFCGWTGAEKSFGT